MYLAVFECKWWHNGCLSHWHVFQVRKGKKENPNWGSWWNLSEQSGQNSFLFLFVLAFVPFPDSLHLIPHQLSPSPFFTDRLASGLISSWKNWAWSSADVFHSLYYTHCPFIPKCCFLGFLFLTVAYIPLHSPHITLTQVQILSHSSLLFLLLHQLSSSLFYLFCLLYSSLSFPLIFLSSLLRMKFLPFSVP